MDAAPLVTVPVELTDIKYDDNGAFSVKMKDPYDTVMATFYLPKDIFVKIIKSSDHGFKIAIFADDRP
uniref:Uncharacterized protein n=1 Tax=viral metagenome TaxID=1070528 RepID=A0A6M3L8E4_9ZZZZ